MQAKAAAVATATDREHGDGDRIALLCARGTGNPTEAAGSPSERRAPE